MAHIKVESISDEVKKYLERSIFSGKLKPGEQIKEQELAQNLGVSRPPIREAFKVLEAEGLLVRRPHKGVFVREIDKKDLWEIYTLKIKLYGMGTELAFENIDPPLVKKLEQVVERMDRCCASDPPEIALYQRLNEQFHDMILEASGHERLRKIVATLHNQVKRFSARSLSKPEHIKRSCHYHRKILEAIKRGHKRATVQLTEEHVAEALKLLNSLMDKNWKKGNVKV
ncbi:MAG TPA: GntR family transcriptional regulator [Desulfobacterales bacterium]|nr:GntR family transcriptional regulator [Desulfobacterales bacterium]